MKTVQMTLDEDLLKAVDDLVQKLGTSRSAFTREALGHALERVRVQEQERCHRDGYARYPAGDEEFAIWEQEQDWGEA